MSESDIAHLRRQIELELVAMQRGMNGFALGTTRHRFIRARMDRIEVCQDQLAVEVGVDQADEIVFGIYSETIK